MHVAMRLRISILSLALLVCLSLSSAQDEQNLGQNGGRNLRRNNSDIAQNCPIFHFVLEIPRTGITFFEHIANAILFESKPWLQLKNEDKMQLCHEDDISHDDVFGFPEKFTMSKNGLRCGAWSARSDYNQRPDHMYTILRDPKAHVVSQYHSCKVERKMPEFKEWLEYWNQKIINGESLKDIDRSKDPEFGCYVPINLQSHILDFDQNLLNSGKSIEILDEIESKFTIIGDQSQMTKSTCAIIARYSGVVPKRCDCSSSESQRLRRRTTSTFTFHNEGESHVLTDEESELLSKITETDNKLYELGKIAFQRQVGGLEDNLGLTFCDSW